MGIRALFANFGLDLAGQPLIFAPRTVLAAYAIGVVVTMAAAWLPARRTARIAPVQALRDDVALPESLAAPPPGARRHRADRARVRAAWRLGLFADGAARRLVRRAAASSRSCSA